MSGSSAAEGDLSGSSAAGGDLSGSSAAEGGVSSPPRPSRPPRRQRTVAESLLLIVLILEAVVLFFASLTAFGLKVLEPALPAWAALPLGGAFMLVLIVVAGGLLRYRWGIWVGWVLQAALIATGILMPFMFLIGAGFAGFWIFCFVKARQIDAARARFASTQGDTP